MGLRFWSRERQLSHDRALERLSAYMDRRLPPVETAQLEAHLRDCERCQTELRSLQLTRRMLQSLPPVRPPRDFALSVAPRPVPMPRGFLYLRAATGVATAAFVALMALSAALPAASPAGALPPMESSRSAPATPAPDLQPAAPAGSASRRAAAPLSPEKGTAPTAQAQAAAAPPPATPAARLFAAPAPSGPTAAGPAAGQAAPSSNAPAGPAAAAPAPTPGGELPQVAASRQTEATTKDGGAQPAPARPGAALPAAPSTGEATASPERPMVPGGILFVLKALTGSLAALLAIATTGLWWTYRRRY